MILKHPAQVLLLVIGCAPAALASGGTPAADRGASSPQDATAAQILQATGVRDGLVVHLGCGDGQLTAALRVNDGYLVEGLDADPDNVAKARAYLRAKDLCGPVSVVQLVEDRLPYADNLVNLLVVDDLGKIPADEVMRVLAPGGVAYFAKGPLVRKKPWPAQIDEWTHFLHDSSNNAVAHDRQVAPPGRLQWVAGPLWSRSHEYDSSLCAMVSAGGRLFTIFDEGPSGIIDRRIPDQWTLIGRDAFNGVVLWKRPIDDWGWKAWKRTKMEALDWSRMPSQRFSLPLGIPRRLVASSEGSDRVYVTLGYRAPVSALDAATGKTITTYAGTERTDEIVQHAGLLVLCIRARGESDEAGGGGKRRGAAAADNVAGPAFIAAVDAATGRRLWQTEPGGVIPLSLALDGPRVFYHDGSAVVSLDAASGKAQWRTPTAAAVNSIWNTDTTLVVYKGVVLCAGPRQLVGLSVADGRVLWKLPGAKGFNVANPPDLFVADGLVWYGQKATSRQEAEDGILTGYEPLTGQPGRTIDLGMLGTHGHHPRCYRSKATDNYLLLPKRGVEFVDVDGHDNSRNNWLRAACRYGFLPCNGLVYSTPHPCMCYAGVKLGGFLALSPETKAEGGRGKAEGNTDESEQRKTGQDERLVRGPAYDDVRPSAAPAAPSEAWPMYRHDAKRSGSTSAEVDCHVSPAWKASLGGKLSQPVVAGGRLFVARVDAGEVCCLDAATGKPIWNYVTAGRVDSSPTYDQGRLIFGSADGHVYCLRASDGKLAWRFQAAPAGRRVVAFGEVESAWPVHGSVLLADGTVYFAAGRSSFLDGGITLYGLDPVTGRPRCRTRLEDRIPTPACWTRTPTPWKAPRATSWSATAS